LLESNRTRLKAELEMPDDEKQRLSKQYQAFLEVCLGAHERARR